jgi:hypothetical protein
MVGEIEVFWIGVKEEILQNQEIEKELIWSNVYC